MGPDLPDFSLKPTDLRGILKYVPLFRDQVFVVSIDGLLVGDDNFGNIFLDVAVFRSLSINVLITFSSEHPSLYEESASVAISDVRRRGVLGKERVDEGGLELANASAHKSGQAIVRGLTRNGLRCALVNAIRATECGVIGGVDQLFRGKVDRVDVESVKKLFENGIVPVVSPIALDREGRDLCIDSDVLASELAIALGASKLIYLTMDTGLTVNGDFQMNVPVEEVKQCLGDDSNSIPPAVRDKAAHAVKTIERGVPRVHIVDGRVDDGLITEIFSTVGIGTMIHGNEYQQIRQAQKKDAQYIFDITRTASSEEVLVARSRRTIENNINQFFVYEIDNSIIGCVCIVDYESVRAMEIASLFVQSFYHGKGVGKKLVHYACREAKRLGRDRIFALSTQSAGFFKDSCGFRDGLPDDLPPERADALQKSGRNSNILILNFD